MIAAVIYVARPTLPTNTPHGTIDERKVKPSAQTKIDLKDVQKTAESVISRIVELKRHRDNGFRMANEAKLANEELQRVVGGKVEWKFSVLDILPDFDGKGGKVRFNCDWKSVDGERFPDFGDGDPVAGRLILHSVFAVRFNHPGRNLEMEKYYGRDTSRDTNDLIIGKEISREHALRLNPGDLVLIRGRIEIFSCSAASAYCILTDVSSKE